MVPALLLCALEICIALASYVLHLLYIPPQNNPTTTVSKTHPLLNLITHHVSHISSNYNAFLTSASTSVTVLMAEAIILSLATSIAAKIAHLTGDAIYASVSERLKASKCAKKDLVIIAEYMHAICAVVEDAE